MWCVVNFGSKEVMEVLLSHGVNGDSPDKVLHPPCPPICTAPAKRRLCWLGSHGDATRACGGVGARAICMHGCLWVLTGGC